MFFKNINAQLQLGTIDSESLRHIKERHIEHYDGWRSRFRFDFSVQQVFQLVKELLKEAQKIGYDDELMVVQNDGHTMFIDKYAGIVIGAKSENHVRLVLRDAGTRWRLVTAYPMFVEKRYLREVKEEEEEEEIEEEDEQEEDEEEEQDASSLGTSVDLGLTYEEHIASLENWDDEL